MIKDSGEGAGVAGQAPDMRRRELANFLRARREAISPEDVGLPRLRRRRTPGLRREEVAFLAGIGAAWYARLEMGHEISPSSETLLSISRALKLNVIETEYIFELAGFGIPQFHESLDAIVPPALELLIPAIENLGAIFFDRYLTMLRWNAVADAIFGIAGKSAPGERNTVHRLIHDPKVLSTFGDDFERLAGGVIAIFRRAYAAGDPTPFAMGLHREILANPRLAKLWESYVVADNVFEGDSGPFERHHPTLGSFGVLTSNLIVSRQQGTILRIIAPADAASAETFKRLAALGSPSTAEKKLP